MAQRGGIAYTHNSSDEELVSTVEDGDQEALGVLWDRHSRPVYSLALRLLRDPEWAEEVSQDVFMKLWSSPGAYDSSRGDLRRWLLTVTHHAAVNGLRGRRGTARERDAGPEPLEFVADVREDPAESASRNLRAQGVRDAIEELPPQQREAVELMYFEGKTQSEVSESTGHPLGTIKTRTRLGLRKLRNLLGKAGENER